MIELHKDVQNRIRASPDMSILLSFSYYLKKKKGGRSGKKLIGIGIIYKHEFLCVY